MSVTKPSFLYFSFPLSSLAYTSFSFFFFFFPISSDFLFFSVRANVASWITATGMNDNVAKDLKTTETWREGGGIESFGCLVTADVLIRSKRSPRPRLLLYPCCFSTTCFVFLHIYYFSLFQFLFFLLLAMRAQILPICIRGFARPIKQSHCHWNWMETQSVDAIHLEWARSDV